jgi:DNA-binding transcriptional regulator LsrR (DeoR family)
MRNFENVPPEMVIAVCNRFLAGERFAKIREGVNKDYGQKFSREDMYPLIHEAVRRNYFLFIPPAQEGVGKRIAEMFGQSEDRIHVVNARGEASRDMVSSCAAKLMLKLIRQIGEHKQPVRIGLGGGGTIMRVSQFLASGLRSAVGLPTLGLHALSSGFDVRRPQSAPVSFFGYFNEVATKIEYVGFFGPALAGNSGDYTRIRNQAGVRESFEFADEMDIVITSLASADDEHGELNQLLDTVETQDKKGIRELRKVERVGDILYRPFTETGPVQHTSTKARAISLFEIRDLVEMSKKVHKHVVLVAGSCGICHKPKGRALRPLLERPKMKVWTHIVTNMDTAQQLLA